MCEMYTKDNSTIINLVNQILIQAYQENAKEIKIKFVDGKKLFVESLIAPNSVQLALEPECDKNPKWYIRMRLPLEIRKAMIDRIQYMIESSIYSKGFSLKLYNESILSFEVLTCSQNSDKEDVLVHIVLHKGIPINYVI